MGSNPTLSDFGGIQNAREGLMKVKDVIERLKEDGWVEVRQESSHRTFKKEGVRQNIAVSGQDREEVLAGQLSDIRRKSGLSLR